MCIRDRFLVPNFIGKFNEWDLRDGEAAEPLMDTDQIREWLQAGHSIGSHSLTHARLTRLTLRDAREEIFASKKKLEDVFGDVYKRQKLHTEFAYRVKSWPMPKNNTGESNQSGLYRQWLRSGCQAFA